MFVRAVPQISDALLTAAVGVKRRPLFVDCTVGCGGHASALLARHPDARLLGIDKDEQVRVSWDCGSPPLLFD